MRWRFGNAFNWYNVLVDETDKHVDGIITTARNPTESIESTPRAPATSSSSQSCLTSPSKHWRATSPTVSTSSQENMYEDSEQKQAKAVANPFSVPVPRDRPSEYLRERCSLCFGGESQKGQSGPHCIVAMDGCFMQKHNKQIRDPE